MKNLYVLIADGGDGSYSAHYTFNKDFIDKCEARKDEYGALGVDGDGFHYDTLQVPDECTLESLGIHYDPAVDFEDEVEDED